MIDKGRFFIGIHQRKLEGNDGNLEIQQKLSKQA